MTNIIEGIAVLEKTPIKEPYLLPFWLLLTGGIAVAVCGVYLWFKQNKPRKKLGICLYVGGIFIMFSSVIPMNIINKETGRYMYKCTMENSVPAKHISDNFKIISVEDNIWTIEDKEK
jgi:hypothetical protein